MDYLKAYYSIIGNAKRKERDVYLELHHIVPRCIYGENLLNEYNLDDVKILFKKINNLINQFVHFFWSTTNQ